MAGTSHAANITMHHYDSFRTGWNQNETVLTPSNVAGSSFGVVATAAFDAGIDAQPLVVQGLNIAGQGTHDVVFIATENNSIYALDATSGVTLLQVNLGPSVPPSQKPRHSQVGIQSTPVIDTMAGTMYVVAYTLEPAGPTYRIHALNLTTLTDELPSTVISAVNQLDDGTQIVFSPLLQRQRPALVEANGNIYAAFGSFGDQSDLLARGWLMGWNANTLQQLAPNLLTNHRGGALTCNKRRKAPCLMSSIWMSGSGVAADAEGYLYAVTGNSEAGTYDGIDNIQETAIKMSPDLSQVADEFTPWNVDTLDANDRDMASGGIMLLPDQNLNVPRLAVAAGKSGVLYLLNRDNLGGHVPQPPDRVVGKYGIGPCWCAESYFTGADGIGRVVTSGGSVMKVWKVVTKQQSDRLMLENTSALLETGQDPGFFTSVSSNGTAASTAVIWAVARPATQAGTLTLYAFDAATAATLLSVDAGTLPDTNFNANVVPVVANGYVYVAGGSHLAIFGLGANGAKRFASKGPDAAAPKPLPGHEIYGTVVALDGTRITLKLRSGAQIIVEAKQAIDDDNAAPRFVGQAIGADGSFGPAGSFNAFGIFRAKNSPALWPADH